MLWSLGVQGLGLRSLELRVYEIRGQEFRFQGFAIDCSSLGWRVEGVMGSRWMLKE